ncbi:Arm DNA-binding domain-containing protein, partial [Granulosicoccus sp.]
MKKLTTTVVESLKRSKQKRGESVPLGGSLLARGLSGSIRFYFEYRFDNKKVRIPFGDYSRDGNQDGDAETSSFTLLGARIRANQLSALQKKYGDLAAHLKEQQAHALIAT